MKKLISVILALVLMLGCAAAESGAMKLTAPAGAPALAVATLAAENREERDGLHHRAHQRRREAVQGRQIHLPAGGRRHLGQPVYCVPEG